MSILEVLDELWPTAAWDECDHLLWFSPHKQSNTAAPLEQWLRDLRTTFGPDINDSIQALYKSLPPQVSLIPNLKNDLT